MQVYKPWCCGPCNYCCLFCKQSLYNTQPLVDFLTPELDGGAVLKSGRLFRAGVLGVKSGEYRLFDFPAARKEDEVELLQAVLASAAFPVALEPRKIKDVLYVDGGVRDVTPIQAAVDAGAMDITIVSGSPPAADAPYLNTDTMNAVDIALRVVALMTNEIIRNDLDVFVKFVAPQKGITYRVIQPDTPLPQDPLNFDQKYVVMNIRTLLMSISFFLL